MTVRTPPLLQLGSILLSLITAACVTPSNTARQVAQNNNPTALRVALCQIWVSGDPNRALQSIESSLEQAAAANADLACFPEACLYGWANPLAREFADPIPGPTSEHLADLAQRYQMMIAVGLAEVDNGQLYNSAVLIDCNGQLLLHHRKVNIMNHVMDPPYSPGSGVSHSVVDTRLGRIGMLICADTFQANLVNAVAEAKPDLLIVPYGWAAPVEDWPEHGQSLVQWATHTARSVNASVIGVDGTGKVLAGPWKGFDFGGQSLVCTSDGVVQTILADRAPDLVVVDVPLR